MRTIFIAALLVPLLSGGAAVAAECSSVARVLGESPLPQAVAALLAEQGVGPAPDPCQAVVATVARADTGISLTLEDGQGRREQHEVATPAMAAVLIETWVRDDLYATLLPAPGPGAMAIARPAQVEVERGPAPFSAGFSGFTGAANDGSIWSGGSAAACARWGGACVGARARFVSDIDWLGASAFHETNRQGYEASLTADFPLELAGYPVVAGGSLGFRTIEAVADEDVSDGRVAVYSNTLQVGAHAGTWFPMTDDFLLEFVFSADLYPGAHTDIYARSGSTLAGDALWTAHASLGFRIGRW